ncbi:AarF/UbiB family protein [Actinoalloteichus sp. AHMU CJ021]|uniref:AarF/UbiB family protein n=1 Tax=Actinoalloteichus sp. AHMU CJ021 TaxID=2072503 RepID=UPI003FCC2CD5
MSIGQVHRATWHDGREVAVKVQYPGAGEALMSDLRQLQRFSRLIQGIVPGTEVKPLLTELQERMSEELDYRVEADAQRRFVKAYTDDPNVRVPRVLASAPRALVTEWVESASPACSRARPGRWSPSGSRERDWPASSATAPRTTGTTRGRCCRCSTSPRRTRWVSSTPTRTPATSCSTATDASS